MFRSKLNQNAVAIATQIVKDGDKTGFSTSTHPNSPAVYFKLLVCSNNQVIRDHASHRAPAAYWSCPATMSLPAPGGRE